MLGWLVDERAIEPHVTVFDKSARTDGTFSREEFTYDCERDVSWTGLTYIRTCVPLLPLK
jgi:hypothetical protein